MEIKKENKSFLITRKKYIKNYFYFGLFEIILVKEFLYCIIKDNADENYKFVLCSLATDLEFAGSLAFKSNGKIKKMSEEFFKKRIFDMYAETKEEIFSFILSTNGKREDNILKPFFKLKSIIPKMLADSSIFYSKEDYEKAIIETIRG